MEQKIGMIGLGIMGSAMSTNLLKAGFSVTGFDILIERVELLVSKKGNGASSCREVADNSDIVITSLPSVEALRDVVHGEEEAANALADALKGEVGLKNIVIPDMHQSFEV